jgi:hypothetical protein
MSEHERIKMQASLLINSFFEKDFLEIMIFPEWRCFGSGRNFYPQAKTHTAINFLVRRSELSGSDESTSIPPSPRCWKAGNRIPRCGIFLWEQ